MSSDSGRETRDPRRATRPAPGEWACLAALLALYLATRLFHLGSLPAFIDEAVHIQSARATLSGDIIAGSWMGRWLVIKLMALSLLLPLDPLIAARLVSVFCGAGAVVACVLIGWRLYSPAVGLVAGAVYVALPYAFLSDRVAIPDGPATAFAGAVIYVSIGVAETGRGAQVIALAVALVAMFLAKFSTIPLALVPVLAVVCLQPRAFWWARLRALVPALVAVSIPLALMVWRGHGTHYVSQQAGAPLGRSVLDLFLRNVNELEARTIWLMTTPLAVATVAASAWVFRPGRDRGGRYLFLVGLLVIAPYMLAGTIWFPRYLTPAVVPVCVLLAAFASDCRARLSSRLPATVVQATVAVAAVAFLAPALWLDVSIALRPTAAIGHVERKQYIESWSAGYGVPELAEELRSRSAAAADGIDVVRFYFWNQAYQGLDLYLSPTPKLALHTIDPNDAGAARRIAQLAARRPTFFVLNPPNDAGHLAEIQRSVGDYFSGGTRVWSYAREGGISSVELWQVPPQP